MRSVARFAPDRIVLLPLYPQYSTATTASSFKAWNDLARFNVPTRDHRVLSGRAGFHRGVGRAVRQGLAQAGQPLRVLFSAHGLPERVIKAGDPYQSQVGRRRMPLPPPSALDDWSVCYQSRVGPLKWIGPSTDRRSSGRAATSGPSCFIRCPSCRSIPRPWSSSTSSIAIWRTRRACRPTSGFRLSAPISCSSGSRQSGPVGAVMLYETLKALHIIAVIAWMAGLLYLPRLFVYHADTAPGSPQSETFKIMERRLLRGIMNPAMILV